MSNAAAARLAAGLDALGLDALVLLSPQSFTYATGLRVPTHAVMRWRHAAALVTRTGVEAVLTVDMEESTVRAGITDAAVHVWKEFREDAMAALAAMVTDHLGPGPLRLGVETDFVPVGAMDRLTALLPEVTWAPCEEVVARARTSKTPDELATVRSLAQASDAALAAALTASGPGDSEHTVGRRIVEALYSAGISEHRSLIVASGERSWFPNVGPSDRVLRPGDVVRVETFAGAGGYQAGVARTAVVGGPSAELRRAWSLVSGARAAALDLLRPGTDPTAVYRAYVEALGPLGDRAIVFFGHGMGLDLHEPPYLTATSTDPLEPGAILGIEPFVMVPGSFGLQVKDVVALTEDGWTMLSDRLDGGELAVIGG
ncbi:MAG TPA: Xaa-Pro peptidase family protein [Cellulomonas sp.]